MVENAIPKKQLIKKNPRRENSEKTKESKSIRKAKMKVNPGQMTFSLEKSALFASTSIFFYCSPKKCVIGVEIRGKSIL